MLTIQSDFSAALHQINNVARNNFSIEWHCFAGENRNRVARFETAIGKKPFFASNQRGLRHVGMRFMVASDADNSIFNQL